MSDATWVIQTSFKTPGGALINLRAERLDELQMGLENLAAIAPSILAVEQVLSAAGNVAAALPLAPPAQQQAAQPPAPFPAQPVAPPAAPAFPQASGAGFPPPQAPVPQFPQQPQQQYQQAPGPAPMCLHNQPAKWIPSGTSKNTGRPYKGFFACAGGRDNDCGFKQ